MLLGRHAKLEILMTPKLWRLKEAEISALSSLLQFYCTFTLTNVVWMGWNVLNQYGEFALLPDGDFFQ